MIFDVYTARLRSLHQPDPGAVDELLREHVAKTATVDAAIAEFDRGSRTIAQAGRLSTRLHQLTDAAQAAGVRIRIEHHSLSRDR